MIEIVFSMYKDPRMKAHSEKRVQNFQIINKLKQKTIEKQNTHDLII